jgi:hypothetical protein
LKEQIKHGVGDIGPIIHYPCVQLEKKKKNMIWCMGSICYIFFTKRVQFFYLINKENESPNHGSINYYENENHAWLLYIWNHFEIKIYYTITKEFNGYVLSV